MNTLIFLPLAVPWATAILAMLLRQRLAAARLVSIAGGAALLLTGMALVSAVSVEGVIASQMGGWPAPFGITLVVDHLSALMVALTGLVTLAVTIYGLIDIEEGHERQGYHVLLHVLVGGVCGAFITGDLFNLYVWFEVMLIGSFGLIILGSSREQIDGGIRYMALNLIATALILAAIALLYSVTGTLNMADLHGAVQGVENRGLVAVIAALFVVAFGIKSAVFPLYSWLPAAYHTPPITISTLFAALLTKVGVYAFLRVFSLIFPAEATGVQPLLLAIAGLTMLTGVLGALAETHLRRILGYQIIASIGFMLMGVGLGSAAALTGAILYVVHAMLVKAALFLMAGAMRRIAGSYDLAEIGGLYARQPGLILLFLVPAFSLAGFPPFTGFWAKLVLARGGLEAEAYAIVATALVASLLTILSMTTIWVRAFWTPHPAGDDQGLVALTPAEQLAMLLPIAALGGIIVGIGLMPEAIVALADAAGRGLADPSGYVAAVLGEAG